MVPWDRLFDQNEAERKLREYRRRGPARTTRILLDALMAESIQGDRCSTSAEVVDASSAYLSAAKTEATRQGHAEHVSYQHGNFVDYADSISAADIVTLDRVIWSAARRPRPRDCTAWFIRVTSGEFVLASGPRNAMLWLERTTFHILAHSRNAVDAVVRRNGMGAHLHTQRWPLEGGYLQCAARNYPQEYKDSKTGRSEPCLLTLSNTADTPTRLDAFISADEPRQ
jgi:hypothetical protein